MEFHVLSNYTLMGIMAYGLLSLVVLLPLFNYWGDRDPSPDYKKGIVAKIVPWVLLCIFISEVCLLVAGLANYPWSAPAEPSQASIYREINDISLGDPLFGWANDKQNLILRNYTGSILSLCWTVYAFSFRKSLTSWWKKACKVVAYLILSALILGFSIHELRELLVYAVIVGFAFILLWIARVKPVKKQVIEPVDNQEESVKEVAKEVNTEDPSRFMPLNLESAPTKEDIKSIVSTQIEQQTLQEVELSKSDNSLKTENDDQKNTDEIKDSTTTCEDMSSEDAVKEADTSQIANGQTEMRFCKYCGKQIETDSTYCKYCGRKLN